MATLDTLPGDQRAVLQFVLGRGRSYDEIARLLSINPDSVRERAWAALDALGPETRLTLDDRQAIGDYLLGQLPDSDVPAVRQRLAQSAADRAWAQMVSSELGPVASGPLPEIPLDIPPPPPPTPATASAPVRARDANVDDGASRSSRRGGMVVIGLGVIAIVVVLVLVFHSSGAKRPRRVAQSNSVTTPAGSSTTSAAASGTSAGSARVVTRIDLSPTRSGSRALAIAEVLQQGSARELAIVAQHVPANTRSNAYEVWLYNSPSDARSLGFVSPGVSSTGKTANRFTAAQVLPANVAHYRQLIVTVETKARPKAPGPILLRGTVTGLS